MNHLTNTIRSVVWLLLLLATVLVAAALGQQPVAPAPLVQSDADKRQEAFQIVWQTVNDSFYDPKFGGVDWARVRERYEPQVAKINNDREFHQLLQQMLNELHQSHFIVIPREAIPKIRLPKKSLGTETDEPDDSGAEELETEEPFDTLAYKLTDRLLTGIGVDLRVLGGSAVVSRVEPGSSAARAGIRPGYVIKKVGSRSLDSVISEIEKHPVWGEIIGPELPAFLVGGFINGEEASPVRLGYLDARNRLHTTNIKRERLKGEMSPAVGNLPALYTEFEAKRLADGVGYIRFNAFVPPLMEKLCGALRSMKNAPGVIIDLRGNQGGLLGMVGGLTGLLETSPTLMGTMQMRSGRIPLFGFPQSAPYSGPLVILVDGSTQSAGEMFARGLQEAGRATLVGQRSAGNTLPSQIKKLPTGAVFQYAFANYETQSGYRLEGKGVVPDVAVTLSRKGLLRGADPQLSVAIRRLREQIRLRSKTGELIADVSAVSVLPQEPPTAAPPVRVTTRARPPTVSILVDDETPPPPPPVRRLNPETTTDKAELPSVAAILEKYLEASGGRSALEKLTSRVSTGTIEMTSLGLTGTVEIDEQAPNKSSVIINGPGLGVMQRTFDGGRGWLQDPLQGIIRFSGLGLEMVKDGAVFNKPVKLKELYPSPVLVGKEKLDGRDVYVVLLGFEKWYFDVQNGLLLRKGTTYYDDYREVDGIKLPFKLRDEVVTGAGIIYRLNEIKHNVKIDETKFTEYPSCFSNRN